MNCTKSHSKIPGLPLTTDVGPAETEAFGNSGGAQTREAIPFLDKNGAGCGRELTGANRMSTERLCSSKCTPRNFGLHLSISTVLSYTHH